MPALSKLTDALSKNDRIIEKFKKIRLHKSEKGHDSLKITAETYVYRNTLSPNLEFHFS
jgi:hypothetical protein